MPVIKWQKGDRFFFKGGYGLVLRPISRQSVMMTRTSTTVWKSSIGTVPEGAIPASDEQLPAQVKLALDTAETASKVFKA